MNRTEKPHLTACRGNIQDKPIKLSPRTTAWKAADIQALIEKLGSQNAEQGASHESQ